MHEVTILMLIWLEPVYYFLYMQSGKTTVCNFLADASEAATGDYHPTQGVRIVEFETPNVPTGDGHTANCEVELWDVSGDLK